jgi:hypothetical protein
MLQQPYGRAKNEITHIYSGSVNFGPLFFQLSWLDCSSTRFRKARSMSRTQRNSSSRKLSR